MESISPRAFLHSSVFLLALLVFPPASALTAKVEPGMGQPTFTAPWYTRTLVGMEVGPTGAQFGSDPSDVGYAAQFNGADIVRKQIEARSEYLVMWARDGEYAYYDSKITQKCPGLGARDPLREAVEAAKPLGLPVIAYCVVQGGGDALRKHPEYRMTGADGTPLDRFCYNSGYLDYMKALAAEMLAYGIDGFHIDMVDQGFGPPYGCWCENCRKRFEAEYGKPMPKGVTWDDNWDRMLEFRYNTSDRFEHALRGYIREIAPNASVDFNYHGSPPFSFEVGQRPVQHADNADFVTGETGIWGFSALGVSLNAEFYQAATPGQPYQVAMQRGVRMYHDQTARPLNDLRWEMFTLLAHGAQVTVVDKTPYNGTLDPVTYDRLGKLFAEVHAKRDTFRHTPLREVGLYYSSRGRDWYGREEPSKYMQPFYGAQRALVYEHIQFGVLLDENLSIETLRQYPVVLLPNTPILSEKEVALFEEYVRGGGILIATGITGLYDGMGHPRTTGALDDLAGVELVRILESRDNHVRFANSDTAADPVAGDIPRDCPFLMEGPAAVFRAKDAATFGELMEPDRTVRQMQGKEGFGWPMSAKAPVGPAVFSRTVGQGKVILVSCSPDAATGGEHPIVEARKFLADLARCLEPAPPVRVTAPPNVEAVIQRDESRQAYLVHLIGYQAPPSCTPEKNRPYVLPSLIETPPMYRAVIEVKGKSFGPVTKCNRSTSLHHESSDGLMRIEVTIEDIHEVIAIPCATE